MAVASQLDEALRKLESLSTDVQMAKDSLDDVSVRNRYHINRFDSQKGNSQPLPKMIREERMSQDEKFVRPKDRDHIDGAYGES